MRPPLVLTGGPATGKSTCGRALTVASERAAYLDVDDIRQLVVSGAEAPWRGDEGAAQHALGARNACALARNLLAAAFEVVISDVATPAIAEIYRSELPDCVLVRLELSFDEAIARSSTRPVHLADEEFALLHDGQRDDPPRSDAVLSVDGMTVDEQVAAIGAIWAADG